MGWGTVVAEGEAWPLIPDQVVIFIPSELSVNGTRFIEALLCRTPLRASSLGGPA